MEHLCHLRTWEAEAWGSRLPDCYRMKACHSQENGRDLRKHVKQINPVSEWQIFFTFSYRFLLDFTENTILHEELSREHGGLQEGKKGLKREGRGHREHVFNIQHILVWVSKLKRLVRFYLKDTETRRVRGKREGDRSVYVVNWQIQLATPPLAFSQV